MSTTLLSTLPRILGSSDPLRYAQYLPGVQTNSELDNGIRIRGCDNSHNEISLDGMPIYGATHFLGLFSVFNPAHFESLVFCTDAKAPNRLGGLVDMEPRTDVPDSLRLNVELGVMSAQAALDIPLGKKCMLGLALRPSYLNLLYGNLLKIDGCPLRYSFGDANLSFVFDASPNDKLRAEAYFGMDAINYVYTPILAAVSLRYGNLAAGINWSHNFGSGAQMSCKAFFSGMNSGLHLDQDLIKADIPSRMSTAGLLGELALGKWQFGFDVRAHCAMPQTPSSSLGGDASARERQDALESSVWSSRRFEIGAQWSLEAFLKLSGYLSPESEFFGGVSPYLKLERDFYSFGTLEATAGMQTQYIFQTGVTNTGLPAEFYFLAGAHCAPQRSLYASLSYDLPLFGGGTELSAALYYKHLLNQVEYCGTVLDLLQEGYSLDSSIAVGSGDNYGLTLMARKCSGPLTGWLSCSLGRSLRHFDTQVLRGTFPSSHERIYQVNAVANCALGRWNLGGAFVFADGIPFTAPESYYVLGRQLISEYGEFNGARMSPYIRLDLSANFYFRREGRRESGLNFSVYNVLCRKNTMACRIEMSGGEYCYTSIPFPISCLPSISYFLRF